MRNQNVDPLLTEIHDLLYQLGVRATIQGFFETSSAVFLAMRREDDSPRFSIMDIYGKISKLYNVELDMIDPRIRRVIRIVWKNCPERLSRIAGEELETMPSPRQFVTILCRHLSEKSA